MMIDDRQMVVIVKWIIGPDSRFVVPREFAQAVADAQRKTEGVVSVKVEPWR